jgi:hypothetical protein
MDVPIRISDLSKQLPPRGSRYGTFRSSSPLATPLAANSSIQFAWIMLRVSYTIVPYWARASLLARSLTRAAFATMHILRENSAVDSAICRGRTLNLVKAPALE